MGRNSITGGGDPNTRSGIGQNVGMKAGGEAILTRKALESMRAVFFIDIS